ncbi:hypothetical protein RS82_02271 [Microbacterium trichothecenolyticum]|uniref:Uncharacterized protein n=2 Tax=Microbacterium trichothecenolyticum TaxID=69370 RepID=A0A0M2H792_MICTR|nr:hypothetical protein RS82_02271 [Microbacterium trichothecenolyticum]
MMSPMSDDLTDAAAGELQALRLRAYGPDADIDDDPQALSRLRELEARAAGATEADIPLVTVVAPATTGQDEPTDAVSVVTVPWWERHRPLLWGGSLLLAVLLGAVVASVQLPSGREQVAVLGEDADGLWPEQMWGARPPDGVTFDEYLGLTAIASARDFGNGTNSTCLWVYDSDSVNFGLSAGSCATGSAPSSTTIAVTAQAPPALLEEFAEGTTLQFVREGDRVIVYAQRP